MADPRKTVSYEGIKFKAATYKIDGVTITYDATKVGGADATMLNKAVSLAGVDGVVQLCSDGEAVEGKILLVEPDGYCTVQVGGYCDLPGGASATLTLGVGIVGALGAASAKGYIRIAASGTAAETVKERGRIVANDTTTAVVVDLG